MTMDILFLDYNQAEKMALKRNSKQEKYLDGVLGMNLNWNAYMY